MVERFERFSIAIAEISRYWHKIASGEMEKYGLKGVHSIYLSTMYRYPDGITAGQLCELCGKDKSDVSRMMSIMEKKGLVKKEGVHQNYYGGLLKLTDEGRAAAEFVRQRAGQAVAIAGKELGAEKREALYEALELIAANLREISRDGLPKEETGGNA